MIFVPEAVMDLGALLVAAGLMPPGRMEVAVATAVAADAVLDQLLEFAVPFVDDALSAQLLAADLRGLVAQWVPTEGMAEPVARILQEHRNLETAQAATVALADLIGMPIVTSNPSLPSGTYGLIVIR